MINFIYGEDIYRSTEALKKIERTFIKEEGDLNVDKLVGTDLGPGLLQSKAQALPFLGNKRLIIIKGLLSEGIKEIKKEAESLLKSLSETTDIVFFEEGVPDKRESLFKALDKMPNRQVYPLLEGFQLNDWIHKKAAEYDLEITREASTKLVLYTGPDLFRLNNEILNLVNFTKSDGRKKIELADIERLVEPGNAYKIFDLTDAVASKNSKKAILVLYAFRKSGEDEYKIFNLIAHQIRMMLIVNNLAGKMTPDRIAKEAGIHPFVAKKTLGSLKNFSSSRLLQMHSQLTSVDWRVKSGQITMDSALELLIVDFCQR